MGAKSNTKKKTSMGVKQNQTKSAKPKINPKKSHAEFLNLKNIQKGLNDITNLVVLKGGKGFLHDT